MRSHSDQHDLSKGHCICYLEEVKVHLWMIMQAVINGCDPLEIRSAMIYIDQIENSE